MSTPPPLPALNTHLSRRHLLRLVGGAELGIGDGLLRLSVGLEAFEDLAADLTAGLSAVRR